MDSRADGFLVVLAGELQVVVQGLAVHRLLLKPGLGDGRHSFFGRGVDEVDPRFGMLGQTKYLAKGYVFRDIVVDQMEIVTLVPAFPFKLLLHVGHNVVVFGMDGHDATVMRHLLKYLPQVTVGRAGGIKGGENLEAGDAVLNGLPYLPDRSWGSSPGQDEMESEIGVGMTGESFAAFLNLLHDRVGGWGFSGCYRQFSGEVDQRGNTTKGSGPAGGFGRLGDNLRPPGP